MNKYSDKISELLCVDELTVNADVKNYFSTRRRTYIIACPKNLGDWYFTGNYPTARWQPSC